MVLIDVVHMVLVGYAGIGVEDKFFPEEWCVEAYVSAYVPISVDVFRTCYLSTGLGVVFRTVGYGVQSVAEREVSEYALSCILQIVVVVEINVV